MATLRLCKHGNRRDGDICPQCANEAVRKRQRAIDRAESKRLFERIRTGRGAAK